MCTHNFGFFKLLFIYLCPCWVFIAACWLFPVVLASLTADLKLQSMGSVVVAHGLSCPEACGIFLDQGSNLCPLHWQAEPPGKFPECCFNQLL